MSDQYAPSRGSRVPVAKPKFNTGTVLGSAFYTRLARYPPCIQSQSNTLRLDGPGIAPQMKRRRIYPSSLSFNQFPGPSPLSILRPETVRAPGSLFSQELIKSNVQPNRDPYRANTPQSSTSIKTPELANDVNQSRQKFEHALSQYKKDLEGANRIKAKALDEALLSIKTKEVIIKSLTTERDDLRTECRDLKFDKKRLVQFLNRERWTMDEDLTDLLDGSGEDEGVRGGPSWKERGRGSVIVEDDDTCQY